MFTIFATLILVDIVSWQKRLAELIQCAPDLVLLHLKDSKDFHLR